MAVRTTPMLLAVAAAAGAQPRRLGFTDALSALQHPDAHVDGFSLHAVLLAETDSSGQPVAVHRRRLRFDDHPPRRRLGLPPFSPTQNSRERVLTLMRLNVAAYPGTSDTTIDRTWSAEMMDGILSENAQLFTSGPGATKAQDDAGSDAVNAAARAELNITAAREGVDWFGRYSPSATAKYSTGVAALEWVRDGVNVLVFRGSYTEGDFANIENWFFDYALERSTARMREAWTVDAGLVWTDEMQARDDLGDLFARTALRARTFQLDGTPSHAGFKDALAAAVTDDATLSDVTLDAEIAKATGYWTLTKRMVDEVVDALPSGHTLLLTGHSQGGTRAQLASMYLSKSRGVGYATQTYAATGGSCAARLLYNADAHLLDDVDPTQPHGHIVDYTHPLDPWGHSMLGVDNGEVCFWGARGLRAGDAALDYCGRAYGYTGPTLIAAQGGVYLPGGADESVGQDFRRCRYFTHGAEATLLALEEAGVVHANGTTDGGCRAAPVIAAGDTSATGCPTGKWQSDELALIIGLAVGLSVPLLCCCCLAIYCIRRKLRRRKVQA